MHQTNTLFFISSKFSLKIPNWHPCKSNEMHTCMDDRPPVVWKRAYTIQCQRRAMQLLYKWFFQNNHYSNSLTCSLTRWDVLCFRWDYGLCKLIWRHWTYKMAVRYVLSSVWVRLSMFSPLSIIQYVGLCVFSLPIPLVMIDRIYLLCLIIIIKSEVWTITHCLGLGHETMVCAVCLSIFLLTVAYSFM